MCTLIVYPRREASFAEQTDSKCTSETIARMRWAETLVLHNFKSILQNENEGEPGEPDACGKIHRRRQPLLAFIL